MDMVVDEEAHSVESPMQELVTGDGEEESAEEDGASAGLDVVDQDIPLLPTLANRRCPTLFILDCLLDL
jgi:hypothetical protein